MSQLCSSCKMSSLQQTKNKFMVCSNPKCKFIEFSPLTYENDVRNFDGERQVEARFNGSYNVDLENGGQKLEFEGEKADEFNKCLKHDRFIKIYADAKKNIKKWGEKLHLSQSIQSLAIVRFAQIYREVDKDTRICCTQNNIAIYALYNAAFEQGVHFIEQKLIRKAGLEHQNWIKVKRDLNKLLLGTKIFLPKQETIFYCQKFCNEKDIGKNQTHAIKQVAENYRRHEIRNGEKRSTEAACIIWMVLKNSKNYYRDEDFSLANIANFFEGKSEATVRKFYQNNVGTKEKQLLVSFPDMIGSIN